MSGKNSQNIGRGFHFRNIKKQRQKKNREKAFFGEKPTGWGEGDGVEEDCKMKYQIWTGKNCQKIFAFTEKLSKRIKCKNWLSNSFVRGNSFLYWCALTLTHSALNIFSFFTFCYNRYFTKKKILKTIRLTSLLSQCEQVNFVTSPWPQIPTTRTRPLPLPF